MKLIKTVLRAFILGLGVGILVAPRAGKETRQLISDKFDNLLDNLSGAKSDWQQTTGTTTDAAVVPNQHYAEGTASSTASDVERSGAIGI